MNPEEEIKENLEKEAKEQIIICSFCGGLMDFVEIDVDEDEVWECNGCNTYETFPSYL